MAKTENGEYGADSIVKMKFPENVRKRPTMYTGQIGHVGMMHLLREIADNSLDEVMNGFATAVEITIYEDGSIGVADDGRGIPVGTNKSTGKNSLTMVFTDLHAGGKFEEGSYKISSGLNGVGAAVVNALSTWLTVDVHRDGRVWQQRFEKGVPVTDVLDAGKSASHGTAVTFMPDPSILGEEMGKFEYHEVRHAYQERAFLNPGLNITVSDEGSGKSKTYCYSDGVRDYARHLAGGDGIIGDVMRFTAEENGVTLDVGMTYVQSYDETVRTFCNTLKMTEGGKHLVGCYMALSKVLGDLVRESGYLKDKEIQVSGEDCREGLVLVVSVQHPAPQYAGQHKSQLGNSEMQGLAQRLVGQELSAYLSANPSKAKVIARKIAEAATARTAARRAREATRKKQSTGFASYNSVSKLSDCTSSDVAKRELFLVEGDSAGGSARNGRDKETQAIYALKGKPLNVEGKRPDAILANKEMSDLVSVIGAGMGADFDPDKSRYGKIVVMSDADVDGSHIAVLLLGMFFRQMRPLIERGMVYLASPPLFRIVEGKDSVSYIRDGSKLNGWLAERFARNGSVDFANGSVEGEGVAPLFEALCRYSSRANDLASATGAPAAFAVTLTGSTEEEVLRDAASSLQESEVRGSSVVGTWKEEFVTVRVDSNSMEALRRCEAAEGEVNALIVGAEAPVSVAGTGVADLLEMHAAIDSKARRGITIGYLKGLGEMTAPQLWETTLDPKKRTLLRLRVDDYDEAGELVNVLLGDAAEERRAIMEDNVERYPREVLDI